jgi:hypothetical protein
VAAAAYFQPTFEQNHLGKGLINMSTDTFDIGLIASGTLATRATSETYEFVSTLLANNGSALTEVSTTGGTGYSRQALTSTSWTISGLTTTFTAANPSWSSATFTAAYAFIYDQTASSSTDATRPLLAIFDFGGAQSVSGSTFTLTVNGSGLVTWTTPN